MSLNKVQFASTVELFKSSRVDEKEMKELRRLLEIKTREVNRLGDVGGVLRAFA